MTNNATPTLASLGLPASTRVPVGDLEVGDWVLLIAPGSRSKDWQQVTHIFSRGSRRIDLYVKDRAGGSAGWRLDRSHLIWRSPVRLDRPSPQGPLARANLSATWPGVAFRVVTVRGGVAVRWTDGPSYEEVLNLLAGADGQCERMERTPHTQAPGCGGRARRRLSRSRRRRLHGTRSQGTGR